MSRKAYTQYHPLQVTLHWFIVILVFATFIVGKSVSRLSNDEAKLVPLAIHLGLGFLTLIVTFVRIIARMRLPKLPRVSTGNAFLDWLGKAVHHGLYLVVVLMALSGISLSVQAGLIPIIFSGTAAQLPTDFYQFSARMLHGLVSPVLLLLVLIHVGAVIYHQLVLRDHLFSRMWYGRQQKKKLGASD